MRTLHGRPMIDWVIERARWVPGMDLVVLATTDDPADDALAAHVVGILGAEGVFRGSENDVLDRYYRCALRERATVVVRITADDPLKDPGVVRQALDFLERDPSLDYCSNTILPTFPEGLDIEAFRFAALERAHREATLASDREHVTTYIWRNPGKFSVKNFTSDQDRSSWRLTVDKEADFQLAEKIYQYLAGTYPKFGFREILALMEKYPELLGINSGTVRNEGYLKSLAKEQDGKK
jgi:spore coat polysaccharide biosynthesis protein SpsF